MNQADFRTYDLALASTLVALGFSDLSIEATPYSNKVSFVFSDQPELREAVKGFWANGLSVNPRRYFDAIKHLKSRIYERQP